MKGVFVALMAMVLSACAPTMVRTYDGPKKSVAEIAIIKGVEGDFKTGLSDYARFKPHTKLKYENFGGIPGEAHMLPGIYVIKIYCYKGNRFAYPKLPIQAKAGMTYELRCEYVPDNKSKVRARIANHYATPIPESK
jgi:hypothetical protein